MEHLDPSWKICYVRAGHQLRALQQEHNCSSDMILSDYFQFIRFTLSHSCGRCCRYRFVHGAIAALRILHSSIIDAGWICMMPATVPFSLRSCTHLLPLDSKDLCNLSLHLSISFSPTHSPSMKHQSSWRWVSTSTGDLLSWWLCLANLQVFLYAMITTFKLAIFVARASGRWSWENLSLEDKIFKFKLF